MINFKLANTETFPSKQRHDVAMHFSPDIQTLCCFSRVYTKCAARVVHRVGDKCVAQESTDFCKYPYAACVLAGASPSCNNIQIVCFEQRDQTGNIARVVLSVAVQRNNEVVLCSFKTCIECRRLAIVAV